MGRINLYIFRTHTGISDEGTILLKIGLAKNVCSRLDGIRRKSKWPNEIEQIFSYQTHEKILRETERLLKGLIKERKLIPIDARLKSMLDGPTEWFQTKSPKPTIRKIKGIIRHSAAGELKELNDILKTM